MDTKQDFFRVIHAYYAKIAEDKLSVELLEEMCNRLTDYYYEQYTRFKNKYPKSIKRYSTFQLQDLDHPTTAEIIVNYFKEKRLDTYSKYSMIVLGMTLDELKSFEKQRDDFNNMW